MSLIFLIQWAFSGNLDNYNPYLNTNEDKEGIGDPNESGESEFSKGNSGGKWLLFIAAGLFVLVFSIKYYGGSGMEGNADTTVDLGYYDDYSEVDVTDVEDSGMVSDSSFKKS